MFFKSDIYLFCCCKAKSELFLIFNQCDVFRWFGIAFFCDISFCIVDHLLCDCKFVFAIVVYSHFADPEEAPFFEKVGQIHFGGITADFDEFELVFYRIVTPSGVRSISHLLHHVCIKIRFVVSFKVQEKLPEGNESVKNIIVLEIGDFRICFNDAFSYCC